MAYLQRGSWRYRLTGNPRRIECFDVDEATSRFTISLRAQKENEAQQTTSRALDVEPIQIPVDPSEELSFRRAWGCLGSITLNEATLVLFITEASIAGSLALEDSTTARIARINDVGFVSLTANQDPLGPSPVDGLKKLLTNGNFYFAVEESTQVKQALYESEYDAQFVWNRYLTTAFASTTTLPALRRVLQGHFAASTYFTERGEHATMTLLSRLSSARAGTRLRTRGVDDDGNVANFCETRTMLQIPTATISFTQIRGSVPVFWEETSSTAVTTKITVTRPQVASMSAFQKHFEKITSRFDTTVVVNLLSDRGNEAALKEAYRSHVRALSPKLANGVQYEEVDFHALNSISPAALPEVLSRLLAQHARAIDPTVHLIGADGRALLHQQQSVFRTNCKDCLDRTNVVQEVFSREAIRRGLELAEQPMDMAAQQLHRDMFASNGDTLSKLYTGTAALSSAITRTGKKGDWKALLGDAGRSLGRLYQNTFLDSDKQEGLDILLGLHRNLHTLESRTAHLPQDLGGLDDRRIWISTYNVEGRSPSPEIRQWLDSDQIQQADVVFVGLQEVVALTPKGVMLPDEAKVTAWTTAISEVLAEQKDPFVLLRSMSLVGTVAILLVRQSQLSVIRDVYASSKKTGLGGTTGNKGAVAISFTYHRTTCCFVSAHLAAGQEQAANRTAEAREIRQELTFPYGYRIDDHEVTLWAADFNFRCDVPYSQAIDLIESGRRDELLKYDQLSANMASAFPDYLEGPISFSPTYKFDHGTDTYDTSEKRRIPAWTDRIIYRQARLDRRLDDRLRLGSYYIVPIRLSDHRPVCASFTLANTAPNGHQTAPPPLAPRRARQSANGAPPGKQSIAEPGKWIDSIDYSRLGNLPAPWEK